MVNIQTINVGLAPNDKKGDPLRDAMQKVNLNTSALNSAIQGVLDGKGQANGYASLGADGRLLAAQAPIVYSAALPTTAHDLNTYVTPGTFYQTTIAGATAGANYPVLNVGFLEIVATGTPVLQVYTVRTNVLASMQRFWRVRQTATLWSVWKEVVDATALAAVKSTADAAQLTANAAIPTAQKAAANGVGSLDASGRQPIAQLPAPIALPIAAHDLDTYDQDGTYGQNATAGAVAGSNYPPEKVAGVLTVQRGGANNILAHQWYRTYFVSNSTIYYRNKVAAGWGDWVRLAKFSEAMTHTFLTTATDANTLAADNTFYTFTSATPFTGGTNWPPTSSIIGGLVEVAYLDGGRVIQTCTLPVGNGKPRIFQRYGDPRAGGAWQTWRMIGAVSSTGWLPSGDAGDVYVDGVGWHRWNGTAYEFSALAAALPSTAHDLNSYQTPGQYRQASTAGATAGSNYPEATGGLLEVVGTGVAGQTKQVFTAASTGAVTATGGPRQFWRFAINTTWSPWQEVLTTAVGMTHTFLTSATDANTLTADNTFYTWPSSIVLGSNFPAFSTGWAAAGYMKVYWNAATQVCQELTFIITGQKPRTFARFGNSSTNTWQPWKSTSNWSSATGLPSSDMGDIYVDGALGAYRWNAGLSAYVQSPPTPTWREGLKTASASTTSVMVYPGRCASVGGEVLLELLAASTRTVQSSGAFTHAATGSGLLTGARAANTWYYIFLLRRNSDGAVCVAFDTTFNCANRPSTHSHYRRVGQFVTDANAEVWAYSQYGNEFWLNTSIDIWNSGALIANGAYSPSTKTPPNVAHIVRLTGYITSGGSSALLQRFSNGGGTSAYQYVLLASATFNPVNNWEVPIAAVPSPTVSFLVGTTAVNATIRVISFIDLFED